MILDLWSFAIILNDILEFVIYWAEHETFTVSFGLATLTFFILAYFAWRSTDIPNDVPSPPRPPFIITIQGTSLNNGGRRQSLSDVHILRSTSTYTPRSVDISRRSTSTSTTSTADAGVQVLGVTQTLTETPPRQQPPSLNLRHGTRSLFFGFLRRRAVTRPILPTRPLLRTRFSQGPNLVVYHRIYHPSSNIVLPSPTPVALPLVNPPTDSSENTQTSTAGSGSTSADVENSEVIGPNQSEIVSHRLLVNLEPSTHNALTTSSVLSGQETPEISQVDPCRVLERSYSDSDLDLAYSSELTTDMDNNEKSDGVQSPPPNINPVEPSSNDVKFTLKFLNDTQKDVTTQFNEKIVDFKRRHFATELNENKIVRLIFNGRVLDNDNKTLQESGIFDQCVVHCLIVTPQPSQQSQAAGQPTQRYGNRSGPRGPEPGMFFVSFMGIILVFLWFICFNFGQQLFTQSAVVSLSVLTAIFLIGLVAFYLPVHPANPNPN